MYAMRKQVQLTESEKQAMWVRKEDGKFRVRRSQSFSQLELHSWTVPTGNVFPYSSFYWMSISH